jgi:Flagellar basal-body P-ring protein
MISANSKSEFEGDGETKRESSITTTVAARVTRVLGGGLMEVVGARETRVNGETRSSWCRAWPETATLTPTTPSDPQVWPKPASNSTARESWPTNNAPGGLRGYLIMCGHSKMFRHVVPLLCTVIVVLGLASSAGAVRLKDVASFGGVRSNDLVGYGLVVGLPGTGDKSGSKFTVQSMANMLESMGGQG